MMTLRIAARRDKFLMNEVVGKKGLRVVQQKMCSSLKEALSFAQDELKISSIHQPTELPTSSSTITTSNKDDSKQNSTNQSENNNNGLLGRGINLPQSIHNDVGSSSYCVVKPCRGVASDDVYFCKNLQDVKDAFQRIQDTPVFGSSVGATHESVVSWFVFSSLSTNRRCDIM